jgi:Flp pilus assembly protein TadG
MAILLFIFFLVVFILMLVGSKILKSIKDAKKAVEEAADLREQRLRNETGRQRQQYSQRQQPQNSQSTQNNQSAQNSQSSQNTQNSQSSQNSQSGQSTESFHSTEYENARCTEAATGETIIDHHHEHRENKKIFDDEEGEYVEFTEEA